MSTPAKSVSKHHKQQPSPSILQPAGSAGIELVNKQRKYRLDQRHLISLGSEVLTRLRRAETTATLTFIRDHGMRILNRDYRGIDHATDVLAFAYHEGVSDNEPNHNPYYLGDVIISVETAQRYATEQQITFETELDWLVIHGLLHLAGYDHETDRGEMRRLERRLRKELLSNE